jgi:hypothetical protein
MATPEEVQQLKTRLAENEKRLETERAQLRAARVELETIEAESDRLSDAARSENFGPTQQAELAAAIKARDDYYANVEQAQVTKVRSLAQDVNRSESQNFTINRKILDTEQQIQADKEKQQTDEKAKTDSGNNTANSGQLVSEAQQAKDENANPVAPGPNTDSTVTPTNATPIPSETGANPTVDQNTNAPLRPIDQTQSTSSQQPNNVGALQTATGEPDTAAPIVADDRPGAGAPSDDQRGAANTPQQTNAVRNRLDELYGGINNAIVSQDNILDYFASYTYSLSWYLMTTESYRRLAFQHKKDLNGYYLLVQSAGSGLPTGNSIADEQILDYELKNQQSIPGNSARSPFFPLDYAIDNLEIDIKYAAGSESQSAASFKEISFTVTEPNGITLLPNLYRAVQDLVAAGGKITDGKSVNYASSLFCMVIRFYGYDQNGVLVQPITTDRDATDPRAVVEKFIPFTLKKIDFSVGSKLVEYKIEGASPDVMTGLSTNRGSVPQDFDFSGTTVKDILVGAVVNKPQPPQSDTARKGVTESSTPKYNIDGTTGLEMVGYGSYVEPGSAWPKIGAAVKDFLSFGVGKGNAKLKTNVAAPAPKADAAPKPVTKKVATGLIAALNNFQQQLVKDGKYQHPDVYDIQFADAILASAKVAPPGGVNKNRAGGTATNSDADAKLPEKSSMSPGVRLRSVRAGTQIVQFIDEVMRNSSYIVDQQAVIYNEKTKKYEKNGKPASQFAWFNIEVGAEPGPYDTKRNDYSYKMTFFVTPYQIPVESEYFEAGGFRGVHKIYNYWFTGQNTQVLNFEQSFDQLWTQALTADTKLLEAAQSQKSQMNSREQWKKHYYAASGENRQGGEGKTFEGGANAADHLYGPNYAEIQLTILGDPAWIPNAQYGFSLDQFTSKPFWPDGTINNSSSVPYFEFAWNRPVDYNIDTGLMDPGENNYFANRGEGVAGLAAEAQTYIAVETKNVFRGGRFSQELTGAWANTPAKNKPKDERTAQTPPKKTPPAPNQSDAETARLARSGTPPPTTRIAGDGSSTAKGVQQTLSPPTKSVNPSVSEIQNSQAYITARKSGLSAREAYDYAAQQFTQGRAGEPYKPPQKIVREP